ncbi:hypothetical protein [Anaerosporobacter sp.]|uniref:hypothetical protein n=1 Tax=Anaerosporobacter sp. TaxID=1872529 RepID=UPI00289F858B|nr:hypothetical protein [Anaerosporobacter sp.]
MGNVKINGYYVREEDGSEFIAYEKEGKEYLTNGVKSWTTDIDRRTALLTKVNGIDLITMSRGLQSHFPKELITEKVMELVRTNELVNSGQYETIVISHNQVIGQLRVGDKDLAKIITPDGYTYLYKKDKLRQSDYDENKLYFSLPSEYKIQLSKSEDTGEIDGEGKRIYRNKEKMVTAPELKQMYSRLNVKQAIEADNKFIKIEFSKNRMVQTFPTDNGDFTRILAPNGFSFIRPSNQIHESNKEIGMAYFSLPKDDYEIKMTRSVNTGNVDQSNNPIYKQEDKLIVPVELKELFQASEEVLVVSFTKNQVVATFNGVNSRNEEPEEEIEFSKILTPMGYTFIRPSSQISYNNKNDRYETHMKALQVVKLQKSVHSKDGGYSNETITVTAKELNTMINEEIQCRRKQRVR